MLKLSYTETGLHMEQLNQPLEDFVSQWVRLILRTRRSLYLEPASAAFLLPANTQGLGELALSLQLMPPIGLTVDPIDRESVELSMQGNWLASDGEAHEGLFLATLPRLVEGRLYDMWQTDDLQLSSTY